ncbi:hypothetical protein DFH07DRAFT_960147 [Mycena maculata]|uniref:Uncharacterized protein n=1 Tax=Mycena maculata TaxID=230809 RepID=A0AAD7J110_9AGAR|nr:hypothetical protein DFH07DRAFT_960147 [Mycena maculata]
MSNNRPIVGRFGAGGTRFRGRLTLVLALPLAAEAGGARHDVIGHPRVLDVGGLSAADPSSSPSTRTRFGPDPVLAVSASPSDRPRARSALFTSLAAAYPRAPPAGAHAFASQAPAPHARSPVNTSTPCTVPSARSMNAAGVERSSGPAVPARLCVCGTPTEPPVAAFLDFFAGDHNAAGGTRCLLVALPWLYTPYDLFVLHLAGGSSTERSGIRRGPRRWAWWACRLTSISCLCCWASRWKMNVPSARVKAEDIVQGYTRLRPWLTFI